MRAKKFHMSIQIICKYAQVRTLSCLEEGDIV
jgi:hypothetical protein